jgi:Major Facilitator Superfamily
MSTQSSAPGPPIRHGAVTAVVCIALAAVMAAMSSLNVAIPSIAESTHASQTQLAWIIDACSLVFAALLLPAGALGDRFGRRRTLLAGLTIFAAGSGIAMAVSGASQLIALRTVIGLGPRHALYPVHHHRGLPARLAHQGRQYLGRGRRRRRHPGGPGRRRPAGVLLLAVGLRP